MFENSPDGSGIVFWDDSSGQQEQGLKKCAIDWLLKIFGNYFMLIFQNIS